MTASAARWTTTRPSTSARATGAAAADGATSARLSPLPDRSDQPRRGAGDGERPGCQQRDALVGQAREAPQKRCGESLRVLLRLGRQRRPAQPVAPRDDHHLGRLPTTKPPPAASKRHQARHDSASSSAPSRGRTSRVTPCSGTASTPPGPRSRAARALIGVKTGGEQRHQDRVDRGALGVIADRVRRGEGHDARLTGRSQ